MSYRSILRPQRLAREYHQWSLLPTKLGQDHSGCFSSHCYQTPDRGGEKLFILDHSQRVSAPKDKEDRVAWVPLRMVAGACGIKPVHMFVDQKAENMEQKWGDAI